jgi:hypothetical protein
MKTFHTILCLFSLNACFGQHLPLSPFLYENYTDIDNYFGEADSLFQRYDIRTVKIFSKSDSLLLMETETYQNGRKISSDEYGPSGKMERTIRYFYRPDTLEAELIHYPSVTNYNLFPARRFYYLITYEKDEPRYIFRRDSITGIVRMRIRHIWQKDGTILFEGFDTDEKMVATNVMRPIMSLEEYQKRSGVVPTGTVVKEMEEYTYNDQKKLVNYKSHATNRNDSYFYDERGLLTRIERFLRGKPDKIIVYTYE